MVPRHSNGDIALGRPTIFSHPSIISSPSSAPHPCGWSGRKTYSRGAPGLSGCTVKLDSDLLRCGSCCPECSGSRLPRGSSATSNPSSCGAAASAPRRSSSRAGHGVIPRVASLALVASTPCGSRCAGSLRLVTMLLWSVHGPNPWVGLVLLESGGVVVRVV